MIFYLQYLKKLKKKRNAKMKAMFKLGKQDLRNHKEAIDLFIKLLYDSEWYYNNYSFLITIND